MELLVVVRPGDAGGHTATAAGIPELIAVGDSPEAAVEQLRRRLEEWRKANLLLRIDLPGPPALDACVGRSANSENHRDYIRAINRARGILEEEDPDDPYPRVRSDLFTGHDAEDAPPDKG